jgi:hypothetical protein
MADSNPRLVRSFRNHAMGTLLAVAALGTMLVASVAVGADSAATPRTLATRGPVIALAADGDRVALVVRSSSRDPSNDPCTGVVVWEPIRRRVVRLQRPRCNWGTGRGTEGVALAGTRAAWLNTDGGNTRETFVVTATLARPSPVTVAWILSDSGGQSGAFAREPVGDGTLLAFTVDRLCDRDGEVNGRPEDQCRPGLGYVLEATVWRVAGRGSCPVSSVRRCSRVAETDSELSVLAVDAGRIAVRTENRLRLLSARGAVLEEFDLRARAAALSGNRLAVRTTDAVEVYDTDSGQRTARFAAARHLRLEDLDREVLVTALGRTVTLRRLGNGRTTTIRAGGIAHAQLERPGLFVAGGRGVTFMPMRDVLRRLGD